MGGTLTHNGDVIESAKRPRYRWRTRTRRLLSKSVVRLGVARKGTHDCGQHEWYKATDDVDYCYHCVIGIRQPSQLPRRKT